MKINYYTFKDGEIETFEYDLSFNESYFNPTHIISVPKCHASIRASLNSGFLSVHFKINYTAIVPDSYTLKPIEYRKTEKEDLVFSTTEDDESNIEGIEKNGDIDLDNYIHAIIISSVPFNVKGKDSKLPSGGEGYRVLTEEELEKERSEDKSSPFDVLDKLDLDD